MKIALETFIPSATQTPGRLNLFKFNQSLLVSVPFNNIYYYLLIIFQLCWYFNCAIYTLNGACKSLFLIYSRFLKIKYYCYNYVINVIHLIILWITLVGIISRTPLEISFSSFMGYPRLLHTVIYIYILHYFYFIPVF